MIELDSAKEENFIRCFANCQRELRAFTAGLTPSQADADDLLQEVNLALWKKRHLYDHNKPFLHWAFGFAALEARSFRDRSARKRLWFTDEVLELLTADWPNDPSYVEQRRDALTGCLDKLVAPQKEMLIAFYSNRATAQQLASLHNRPLSTIYKILNRLRDTLRGCVERSMSQLERSI